MNSQQTRDWKVLCWNVSGLNSEERQISVRAKIEESQCSVICLQETKCEFFDQRAIRKFCPRRFDNFVYSSFVGASGGILVLWCSSVFSGTLVDMKPHGIIVTFTSVHNANEWTLVNVYDPCQGPPRDDFV